VGSRDGLDVTVNKTTLAPARNKTLVVHLVASHFAD